jgi:phosphoserine phosphatase
MAELGINPHTISMILNHVSARQGTITNKVYDQYSYDREKREALDKWAEQLEVIL